jgi:phage tail sheath protein FI
MAVKIKTPGVYIVEKNAFLNPLVEVATAVPAFIGHTRKARNKGESLPMKPKKITSMAEYHSYFGAELPAAQFTIDKQSGETDESFSVGEQHVEVKRDAENPGYLLYYSMLLFFKNGGGPCFVVSVGDYQMPLDKEAFIGGIDALLKEQEPTLVVIPEAIRLSEAECREVQQLSLAHCGEKMKNRFSILDIWNGDKSVDDPENPI